MTENNLDRKLDMNLGLRKDSKIKFKEYFPIDKIIPEEYYMLYGDCAPQMFERDKLSKRINGNIKKAYNKNKVLGFIVKGYYNLIYKKGDDEDKISKDVFKSLKWIFEDYPELIKKV